MIDGLLVRAAAAELLPQSQRVKLTLSSGLVVFMEPADAVATAKALINAVEPIYDRPGDGS